MTTATARERAGSGRDQTLRLTTAQALVRHLQVQWSERDGARRRVIPAMFGIFGHGNLPGLGQALSEHGAELPFHQPKNEQSMVHTAIGYAKATRRLATLACTASIGPGSTNMVTGAATATTNRLPVLLLPADTFANRKQGPVLQQLEHPVESDLSVNDCLRPVSRFFDRIARPEQLLTALPEAMRVLLDPAETGAVTLCLHQDVQGEAYDWPASFFEERTWPVVRRPPAAEEIAAAAELLRASERPLIIAGGGVRHSDAQAELEALATGLGIPVCETSAGKGTVRTAELLLGGVGVNGTRAANAIAREADLVICAGTRLSDFTTASHSLFQHPEVRFVGLNVCPADAYKLGALPVVADARLALTALAEAASGWSTSEAYRIEVEQALERWNADLAADLEPRAGELMSQGQLLRTLNRAAQPGDWVVAAAGSPPGDLLKSFDCTGGIETHIEFAYSCMGHELPAALGIRMATPSAGEVYAVIGDGTYLMAPSELATAVQEGLKVTVVLVVNHGYQSIHGLQTGTVGESFGNEFRHREGDRLSGAYLPLDFAANARSLGCAVFEAGNEEELGEALEAARADTGVSVIVAEVEPRRALLDGGAWWDLGVAQVSESERTRGIAAEHARGATAQRFYG
ncbi:MAG: 3D-(3,5/4)-trihydroxycyclohexane-1,2-dione acylhydrolase (decyclizing) [Thermoleophilaceae bacterium]